MTNSTNSEAACLLESGKLYKSRVGLASPADGSLTFAGFKKGAFSLYFGDSPIYHFDLEGRWQRVFLGESHFLKGLDTTIHRIERIREGANLVLRRSTLSFAEAADLDARVREMALDLAQSIASAKYGRKEPSAGISPLATSDLLDFLDRIAAWDADAWFSHRERYTGAYGPLPFIPPDSQNPVVVQATLGHPDGIGFGGAPVAEHYVRSVSEFETHCREVGRLLGRRLAQCRSVFLAGADVLRQAPEIVIGYLNTIGKVFPFSEPNEADPSSPTLDGVHTFLDQFQGLETRSDFWTQLKALGLKRVSLGVESGDSSIRERFGKRWSDGDLRSLVSAIKSAEIGISVLTLVGAGGIASAEPHEVETARLIKSLGLGSGDLVFLLDANEVSDSASESETQVVLTGEALAAQLARLKDALKPDTKGMWKVLPYSLEKQWA